MSPVPPPKKENESEKRGEMHTHDQSHQKPQSPSGIKESQYTPPKRPKQSILADNPEIDECRDEDDGSEKGSCDGRELQIVSDKVWAVVAWLTSLLCHSGSPSDGRRKVFYFYFPPADPRQQM